jgi:phosphoesterase RecJ-like protein
MQNYPEASAIAQALKDATRVLIMQADNPDGDSLGSALALEQILGDMGKEPLMYCGVTIPSYLTHMTGWDRVGNDIPTQFDASIIVDTSSNSLFGHMGEIDHHWLKNKPCIVLDHHPVENTIPEATIICNKAAVATSEVIYELAQQLDWPLNKEAKNDLATAILSDSLGLTSGSTTARSIHIIAELVEGSVSIAELENKRREMMRKSPGIVHYKGDLLKRIEYYSDDRIATVTIPWEEIERYSHAYNPSVLVLEDMRLTEHTDIAIAFKTYKDGKVTGKIRCNHGFPIGNDLAQHFGGGGHPYASGFKVTDGRPYNEIKSECIRVATELLDTLDKEQSHETI